MHRPLPAQEAIVNGCAFITPKAHAASYLYLPDEQHTARCRLVDRVRWLLAAQGAPEKWRAEAEGSRTPPNFNSPNIAWGIMVGST
ncbi:MAG: hypothetical protein IAE81_21315 [Caldilineaceae bacterium]|jgi:hypothetical protein|nr:hypothetical protein [Caldilineaceae bacterium]